MGQILEGLKVSGKKAIVPYLVAGFPSLQESLQLLLQLQNRGATALEVGIPFSDPVADGPVIQKAHTLALQRGVTPGRILRALKELRSELRIPIILMTYYNPIFRLGEERFAREAKEAGVSGVIVPDLPPEEAHRWIKASRSQDIDTVFLVAPNTPEERVRKIARVTTGFLYYLSLKGVTGSRIRDLQEVRERVEGIKRIVDLPVYVGFGIKEPWEVEEIAKGADGIIVGSSLLYALQEGGSGAMVELFERLHAPLKALCLKR